MAISKDNIQVYLTLPKELINKIDKESKKEMRTRSKHLAKIIIDYYEKRKD